MVLLIANGPLSCCMCTCGHVIITCLRNAVATHAINPRNVDQQVFRDTRRLASRRSRSSLFFLVRIALIYYLPGLCARV